MSSKTESKNDINIKKFAIFFGLCPSVNKTILSFSFDSLKKLIATDTKNAIGTVKSRIWGIINKYSLRSSTKLISI